MQHFLPEDLIAKYLSADITPAEERDLFVWIEAGEENRAFFEEVVRLWGHSRKDDDFEADVSAAWAKVESAIEMQPRRGVIRPIKAKTKWWRIAATVLLLVIAGWWLLPDNGKTIEVIALENEVKEIILPDGSHVWLNENSRLTYNDQFAPRDLDLSGEAFFEVTRDEKKPFTIYTESATTRVLGTSFNIKAYPQEDSIVVTVKTGKVAVQNIEVSSEKVELKKGDAGIVYKREQKVKKVEAADENFISWKTKKLFFDNVPMRRVVSDLEDYFDVNIKVKNPAILNCSYRGRFIQPKLDEVLDALNFATDFTIKKSADTIIIDGKGCGE